jgi:hypothetical protein
MKWSETSIARALAQQFFNRKYLVVVPNCTWPGSECDLLCITENLRVIDVEIKISRSDLRADAKKDKWWHSGEWQMVDGRYKQGDRTRIEWPRKVWKHYYAMPKEIWTPDLFDSLPSKSSGVLLLSEQQYDGHLIATCARRATPCREAAPISAAAAIEVARLASLRMWDSYKMADELRRAA